MSSSGAGPSAQPPVPLVGLSLAALRAFVARHAGRSILPTEEEVVVAAARRQPAPVAAQFETLTTALVVTRVIKPAMAPKRCSYAELLQAQARLRRAAVAARAHKGCAHAARRSRCRGAPKQTGGRTWRAPPCSCRTPGHTCLPT